MTEGSDSAAISCAAFRASSTRAGGRYDPGDKARALRLGRVHHAARQTEVHRLRFADGAGQALGAARARDDAQLDLGLTEPGRVGRDDEVAHHREFAAAAERKAGHRGDDRLAPSGDAVPGRDEVVQIGGRKGEWLHLTDVGSGREGLLGPGDHDGSDRPVRVGGLERLVQLGHERGIEGVKILGPVQCYQDHASTRFDDDRFELHEILLPTRLSFAGDPTRKRRRSIGAAVATGCSAQRL
jgi:hypothetical protein